MMLVYENNKINEQYAKIKNVVYLWKENAHNVYVGITTGRIW
jgi:hypothetical protein